MDNLDKIVNRAKAEATGRYLTEEQRMSNKPIDNKDHALMDAFTAGAAFALREMAFKLGCSVMNEMLTEQESN